MRARQAIVVGILVAWSFRAAAEPNADEVPPPLRAWIPWVLASEEEIACAHTGGKAICEWPAALDLDVGASGGSFEQRVRVDRDAAVLLPGSVEQWPRDVRVDGQPVAVLDAGEAHHPSVRLAAGVHRLAGTFRWASMPERIRVPPATARLWLRVAGEPVPFPRRDAEGRLWLAAGDVEAGEAERLDLSVHRKIEDGVPLFVTTRMELRVSGRARELSLGKVLLDGTAPVSITSELPARLDSGGELHVQVAAGSYRIEVRARSEGSPSAFVARSGGAGWPEAEIWVWQADEALRQVDLKGAPAIDPARTDLGDDWRGLPTFILKAGTSLALETSRRGEPDPPPSKLTLNREMWLDLDGRGYSVRDQIHAELRQGWRLDLKQGALGHVASGGTDLLVTRTPGGTGAGVEIRQASQDLTAEWRAPDARSRLPAVGWSEDVQSLAATLHLGPGWSVLAARGVDEMGDTWIEKWDLFGFFFVLLVALAVGRLLGRRQALLALATLVLCQHEAGAPHTVWLVLVGLAALAGARGAGRLADIARASFLVAVGALLLIAVPFAVAEVRSAIYPQLEDAGAAFMGDAFTSYDRAGPMRAARPESAPVPASVEPAPQKEHAAQRFGQEVRQETPEWLDDSREAGVIGILKATNGGYAGQSKSRVLEQDPEAVVQTGPGMPSWRWRSWSLRWNGPVDREHELRLWLVPPFANRALSLLRVLLVALFAFALVRKGLAAIPSGEAKPPAAASAGAALFLCAMLPGIARAQLPDADLLGQLRERLTKPAPCRPECVSIDELRVRVDGERLALVASVHAGDRTSVRLPGPAAAWVPVQIVLDGTPEAPVRLHEDGFLHVRVEPGLHVIEASGPLPPRDALTLAMGDPPHHVEVETVGWKVDGVREDGRVQDAIQLSRALDAKAGEAMRGEELPPWLRLERSFELGPIWQVHSTLRRVSPPGTPILVHVALLAGEAVAESSLEVKDGRVEVPLGRDDTEVNWTSTLDPRERLELRAAEHVPWSERWTLRCGPIWRCVAEGLAPVRHLQEGTWSPEFAPWPGEALALVARRPPPAAGQSVTIDSAELEVTPGVRVLEAKLNLRIRSSRGAVQRVELPAGAKVRSLTVDGVERPLRQKDRTLAFTLGPSAQSVVLAWQESEGVAAVQRVPSVRLHGPAANASVVMHVPSERWLLWASGPAWGPAILFWGYLLMVLFAALALGRVPTSPLRGWQWALLGLGLTQVPVPAALVVVGWFFLLERRARMPEVGVWTHNFVQLGLIGASAVWVGCLYLAVHTGLLMQPDMQVAGAGSHSGELRWYVDRVNDALPNASIVSAPMWAWRALMLAWSLWLAWSLLRWVPWAWRCFRTGGVFRRKAPPPPPAAPPPEVPPDTPPDTTTDAWRPVEPLP